MSWFWYISFRKTNYFFVFSEIAITYWSIVLNALFRNYTNIETFFRMDGQISMFVWQSRNIKSYWHFHFKIHDFHQSLQFRLVLVSDRMSVSGPNFALIDVFFIVIWVSYWSTIFIEKYLISIDSGNTSIDRLYPLDCIFNAIELKLFEGELFNCT